MSLNSSLECPVDFIPVNENKIRIIALQIFILSILSALSGLWPIIAFLVIDFFLRSFNLGKFSPLAFIADCSIKLFSVKEKPIDQAPKRFAARMGLVLSTIMLITFMADFKLVGLVLIGMLAVFSFLESFLGFCAGCHIYTFLRKIFPNYKF